MHSAVLSSSSSPTSPRLAMAFLALNFFVLLFLPDPDMTDFFFPLEGVALTLLDRSVRGLRTVALRQAK